VSVNLLEDLADLAAYEFHAAQKLCRTCENYHALWGYERLAGLKGNSFETERDLLQPLLNANVPERGNIFIAGAADAGLLAMTAQLAHGRAPRITVVDRCATPLAVCARYAEGRALSLATVQTDLTSSPLASKHDLAFAHNVLMLQPADLHAAFLGNIRESLNDHGAFVLVHRVRSAKPQRLPPTHYASRTLAALVGRNIPLPEAEGDFRKRLESYAEQQHVWSDAVLGLSHVEWALDAAGFRIIERIDHQRRRTVPDRDGGPPMPMPTHIFLAKPKF